MFEYTKTSCIQNNTIFKGIIVLIGLEIFTGIWMYYFDFPFLSQPLHLVIASILFGIQMYILLEVLYQKRTINKAIAY